MRQLGHWRASNGTYSQDTNCRSASVLNVLRTAMSADRAYQRAPTAAERTGQLNNAASEVEGVQESHQQSGTAQLTSSTEQPGGIQRAEADEFRQQLRTARQASLLCLRVSTERGHTRAHSYVGWWPCGA